MYSIEELKKILDNKQRKAVKVNDVFILYHNYNISFGSFLDFYDEHNKVNTSIQIECIKSIK